MADKGGLTAAKMVRLLVPAAKAKPSPAIGQALGQLGVNMMAFCKEFNAKTVHYVDDVPLRVKFTAFPDKTFKFVPLLPMTSWFVKKAANIETCAHEPGKDIAGSIHVKQLYEIAKIKQAVEPRMKSQTLEQVAKTLASNCMSMGIAIDNSPRGETVLEEKVAAKKAAAPAAAGGKKK